MLENEGFTSRYPGHGAGVAFPRLYSKALGLARLGVPRKNWQITEKPNAADYSAAFGPRKNL
jgi:hypothetical protein